MSETHMVVDSVDVAPEEPLVRRFLLDRPRPHMLAPGGFLEFVGRVVTRSPAQAVEVVHDGFTSARFPLSMTAQDAKRAKESHPRRDPALPYGFRGTIALEGLSGNASVMLRLVLEGREPAPLARISFRASAQDEFDAARLSPDFLIIGAMKAGTSALYSYLTQHPRVIDRRPKELHFFTHRFDKGLDFYLSRFWEKKANPGRLIGEASPSYLADPEVGVARRVKQAIPATRIIALLRDPAERAVSHFFHEKAKTHREPRPNLEIAFSEEAISDGLGLTREYLAHGEYARRLEPWLREFPAEQVLVLDYHDLETDPAGLVRRTFGFLGLEPPADLKVEPVYRNDYPREQEAVYSRLRSYYAPHNRRLAALIGPRVIFARDSKG